MGNKNYLSFLFLFANVFDEISIYCAVVEIVFWLINKYRGSSYH